MTYEQLILRRIDNRTCSRREWHALRRYRSARARGLPVIGDFALAPAVITADWIRACRAVTPIMQRHVARMRMIRA